MTDTQEALAAVLVHVDEDGVEFEQLAPVGDGETLYREEAIATRDARIAALETALERFVSNSSVAVNYPDEHEQAERAMRLQEQER